MKRNFNVENIDDDFLKVSWALKNETGQDIVWNNIKNRPLINDNNAGIGILNNFTVKENGDKFEFILEFVMWKKCLLETFTDIKMILKEDVFEFKMI